VGIGADRIITFGTKFNLETITVGAILTSSEVEQVIRGGEKMNKPLLALTLSAFLGAAVAAPAPQSADAQAGGQEGHAGHRGGQAMDPQKRVDMLAKRLNLTDDQKQKLLPILTEQQEKMKSIRDDSSLSRDDRFQKMRDLREETDNKINPILTDEQRQKYAEMQQKARERMQQRMHDHGNGGGAPEDSTNKS
jgi:periplasmic protein CpxP/Spy